MAARATARANRSSLRRSVVSGIEALSIDRRHAPGHRRRAHQRARQPQVQGADRRRASSRTRPRSAAPRCARGAHVLDVCLQDPDRDEIADITGFLETWSSKVKVPLMIDSTDANVHRSRRSSARRASRSSTRSTSRTARSASSTSCRSRAATARRWSSAASTRTSSRRRRSRASASSRSPSARSSS